MGRENDIGAVADGCVGGQGFDFEDVQCGTGDPAFFESFNEVGFVDDGAACSIDQDCRWFHEAEEISIDEAPGRSAKGAVDAEVVRVFEECGEVYEFYVETGGVFWGGVWIVSEVFAES